MAMTSTGLKGVHTKLAAMLSSGCGRTAESKTPPHQTSTSDRGCMNTAAAHTSSRVGTSFTFQISPISASTESRSMTRARPFRSRRKGSGSMRTASIDRARRRLVCVREDHIARGGREPDHHARQPAARRQRRRRRRHRVRPRFLFHAAIQPGRHADSHGWRGTTRRCRGTAPSSGSPTVTRTADAERPTPDRGGRKRRDLSAGMGTRRHVVFRLGSDRLVESISLSEAASNRCTRWTARISAGRSGSSACRPGRSRARRGSS